MKAAWANIKYGDLTRMEIPKVSFHFSLDMATTYALEMALEAHLIKMKIHKQPVFFSEEFLKECREEFSLADLFWHLRASMTREKTLKTKVKRWAEYTVHPIMEKAVKNYEPHWKEIVSSLKRNAAPLIKTWKKHEKEILKGVSSSSRFPWVYKKIKVFFLEPIVGGHGDAFIEEGAVTLEVVKARSRRTLMGLTHEIAHLNTASIMEQEDIRKKVLAEVVNDFVAQQSLIIAEVMRAFDQNRLNRIFTHDIKHWMTESKERFTYNPSELRQITETWWTGHLKSENSLLESIEKLFEKLLPKMKFK